MPLNLQDIIKLGLVGSGSGGSSGGGGGGWPEVPDDGATYLFITLPEGRTSPKVGIRVNGTVTVDWGDGTTPDVLTGTNINTTVWTPNHEYAKPGDYVIRMGLDGEMLITGMSSSKQGAYILRHSSSMSVLNKAYQNTLRKAVIGKGATIGNYAFQYCKSLESLTILANATDIGSYAFQYCCPLKTVVIPNGATTVGSYAFYECNSIEAVVIPGSITNIYSSAFYSCYGCRYYDFTRHTFVPAIESKSVFEDIASDCEIRVPAALYDEWIAATNWATYAANIKAY
jgi:hypothetical protein